MSYPRVLLGLLLASCSLSLACSAPHDDSEKAEAQDNDLKKKVKPKGGDGAFDLLAPGFDTTGFGGTFTFDNAAIKVGERSEKVPGTYALQTVRAYLADNSLSMGQALSVPITTGVISKQQIGGLRVRFAEPVTLGSARVDLDPVGGVGGGNGFLPPGGTWQTAANGTSMLALPGQVNVTSNTDGVTLAAVIAAGALREVVLPISHVAIQLDAYDAAYPTPPCSPTSIIAGATNTSTGALVRKADGSPNASFVVPAGALAPVSINAYGIQVTQPTVAGGTNKFTLNRLEIDDVEVAQAGGASQFVRGTVTISRMNPDGTFASFNCSFPTHSGLDLPDGSYRLVSTAQAASGQITSTDEVSFP